MLCEHSEGRARQRRRTWQLARTCWGSQGAAGKPVQRERGEGRALDDWEEEGRGGGGLDYLAGPTRPRHVHVSLFMFSCGPAQLRCNYVVYYTTYSSVSRVFPPKHWDVSSQGCCAPRGVHVLSRW